MKVIDDNKFIDIIIVFTSENLLRFSIYLKSFNPINNAILYISIIQHVGYIYNIYNISIRRGKIENPENPREEEKRVRKGEKKSREENERSC